MREKRYTKTKILKASYLLIAEIRTDGEEQEIYIILLPDV